MANPGPTPAGPIPRCQVSFTVVQVDPSPDLEPYAWERARLAEAGGTLRVAGCTEPAQVAPALADADVAWLSWSPPIDRAILAALDRCRLVIRWGIGYDQIDAAAATELGIAVANAPTYGTEDVAELAIGHIFSVMRRIPWAHTAMVAGGWVVPDEPTVHRITGKTLGILGVGRIGSAVARRAQGLGLRVLGTDIAKSDAELRAIGVEPVSHAELAAASDILSIHIPYSAANHHLVDAAFLARMRRGAVLVNTARGRVIDQPALAAALRSGHLGGAGIDVYEVEPPAADDPIRSAPNVSLTCHHAGFTQEAIVDLRAEMVRTTIDFMTTGWSDAIVNPEVRGRLRPPTR